MPGYGWRWSVDSSRATSGAHRPIARQPDTDLRPTGAAIRTPAEARHQRQLDHRLETAQAGIREWTPRIIQAAPTVAGDPALPVLAARLAQQDDSDRAGRLLQIAVHQGPMPDEHPADALNYRIRALEEHIPSPPQRWETVTPRPPRPPRHEPPRMSGPSLGISICPTKSTALLEGHDRGHLAHPRPMELAQP